MHRAMFSRLCKLHLSWPALCPDSSCGCGGPSVGVRLTEPFWEMHVTELEVLRRHKVMRCKGVAHHSQSQCPVSAATLWQLHVN